MENFQSVNVLHVLVKNARLLFITVLVAAVLSFAGSFLLKEKYKSVSVVYPINLYESSEESHTEQLLQYFLSEDVRNRLAKEFDLYTVYEIDTLEKGGRSLFNYVYQENFKVSPTLYESIEISVTDTDPLRAKKMNEAMIRITNEIILSNKHRTMREYLTNARRVLDVSSRELDSLAERMKKIRQEYNIVDERAAARAVSRAMVKGNMNPSGEMMARGLKEKGPELIALKGRMRGVLASMQTMREQTDKYLMDAEGVLNFIVNVSSPSLPDKRCFPVRWVIVLLSSLSALMLGSIVLVLRNRIGGDK